MNNPTVASKLTKVLKDNKIPRYFIYSLIAVKFTLMYDKIKQLVAINNIYAQIVQEQRANFRTIFAGDQLQDNVDGI